MRVWQCDRCKKIYEKNHNEIIKYINSPAFEGYEDYSACYLKIHNKALDCETDFINLCDDCFQQLYNWYGKGKSL